MSVCPSVCPSVCDAVHCGAVSQCMVESCTIVFQEQHFLFTSSVTIAVGWDVSFSRNCCRVYRSATKQRKTEPPKFLRGEHGHSRRGIFGCSVLQLYCIAYVVYVVRSA